MYTNTTKQQYVPSYAVLALAAVGVIAGLSDVSNAETSRWSLADGGNDHVYQVVIPEGGITWTEANAAAEAAGGHLATLTSQAEFDFVDSLAHPTKGWVGGFEDGTGWHWVTNEPFEDVQWCSGQPGTGGDYLQLAYGCLIADGDTPDEGEFYVIEYQDAVQWRTNDGGNGHWYVHHTFDEPTHVLDAQEWAESIGGYIATVRSDAENDWVWNSFGNSCLGGYQDFDASDFSEPHGGWRWANGEPWDYANWLPGEPNNANGNEHGVAVCCPPSLQWNDIQLYNVTYLVEFDADCNGDGFVDYGQIVDGTLEDADNDGVPDICDGGAPTTWAWGDNTHGQCDIPVDLGSVLEMTGSGDHVIALLPDGSVRCWGRNQYGQADVPADLGSIIDVAAGDQHSIALRVDGTVRCWGANMHGQCAVPNDLGEVVAVGSGANHTLAILADGTVRAWGYSPHGATNVPSWLDGVTKVTGGAHHSAALRADGTVVAWGGTYGESNVPSGLSDAVDIKASNYNTIALDGSGEVLAWGRNWFGQANVPPGLGPCAAIGIGHEHGMAVEIDGSITCWGSASDGQCAIPDDIESVDSLGETGVFVTAWVSFKDCNADGQADYEQISDGSLEDTDGNGIPDVCDCLADFNGDGLVTVNDLLIVIAQWGTDGPLGDADADGMVDINDLLICIQSWGGCS